jgi:SSS family solute:Na+ symporter
MVCGTGMAFMVDLKPLYSVGGTQFYIGLIALVVNLVVTFVISAAVPGQQAGKQVAA